MCIRDRNNTLAAEFAVDGKIIGVPEKISTDYVFYWADMFEEAGVEAVSYTHLTVL